MPEKESKLTVKVGCDNSQLMAALDEIEKKIEAIAEKANQLKATLSECGISADRQRNSISGIEIIVGDDK